MQFGLLLAIIGNSICRGSGPCLRRWQMLLNMTIANFKSVKSPQTISFQAVRDSRLPESKVVAVNDKLKVIKTSAIIGPNGAGKSSFVRALEVLKRIVMAPDGPENPLQSALTGTTFAYGIDKATPATIQIEVLLDKGDGTDEHPSVIARYTLRANKERIFEESLYYILGSSKKLMFERMLGDDGAYAYRFGKLYRGEKKRQAAKLPENRTFLAGSARKGGQTSSELYGWFENRLNILPMGVSSKAEAYVCEMLKAHPGWGEQFVNYLWALDITDISRIEVKTNDHGEDHLRYTHIYVNDKKAEGYANMFQGESLSLRRLTAIGFAFFEAFITQKTLVIDDFGQLLHPDVLCHIVEIFENCDKESQMLVVDCNPSLLRDGLLRRDAIWFAQKDSESSTEYFSLSDFKGARSRIPTSQRYMPARGSRLRRDTCRVHSVRCRS